MRKASASVVKVLGEARCNRAIEGSGFVISPHHVMTNAHVVAGTSQVSVVLSEGAGVAVPAQVVQYDPARDVAVLDVPRLSAAPLSFTRSPAPAGARAVVLGYPEDGPTISGANIYGDPGVRREVYSIRSTVRSGNSGGPLLADDGTVLGVVFATDLRSPDTGYALSAAEVAHDFTLGRDASTPVATGGCTPE